MTLNLRSITRYYSPATRVNVNARCGWRCVVVSGAIIAVIAGFIKPGVAASTAPAPSMGYPASPQFLQEMSQQTQSLYNHIQQSLVVIKPSRNPDALLPPALQKKFMYWKIRWIRHHHLKIHAGDFHPGPRSHPTVVIEPLPQRFSPSPPRQKNKAQQLAQNRRVEIMLLRHFLFRHGPGRTDLPWPILHGILLRLHDIQHHRDRTLYGLATGQAGHILVLEILAPPGDTHPVSVLLPDGKVAESHIFATNYFLDMTVLTVPASVKIPSIPMAQTMAHHPALLLAIAADEPAVRWLVPIQGRGFSHPRKAPMQQLLYFLRTAPDPSFIFNPAGHLAAVTTWKKALSVTASNAYLRQFIDQGQVEQVRFGIRYALVPAPSPLRRKIHALGHLMAIRVTGVYPHSPAKIAGIRPGDIIIGIDGAGLAKFSQITKKIHAHPNHVTFRLIRHNHVLNVLLKLQPSPWLPPHGGPPRHPR